MFVLFKRRNECFLCVQKKTNFLFSLHVHHGGSLVVDESCEGYIDGKVHIKEGLSPDIISLVDIYKLRDKVATVRIVCFGVLDQGVVSKMGWCG